MSQVIHVKFDQRVEVPALLLGFEPEESVVAILFSERRVVMCARVDATVEDADGLVEPFANATYNSGADPEGLLVGLVAYTADPERGAALVERLRGLMGGPGAVPDARVVSGGRFWEVLEGRTVGAGTEVAHGCIDAAVAAGAVGEAVSREDVVGEVRPVEPFAELVELWGTWWQWGSFAAGTERLLALLEGPEGLGMAGAVELAELLEGPERVEAVLERLDLESAPALRPRLAAARRFGEPDTSAGDLLVVLGLACWLDGQGAQVSECLLQLEEVAPNHPVAGMLERLSQMPPSVAGF